VGHGLLCIEWARWGAVMKQIIAACCVLLGTACGNQGAADAASQSAADLDSESRLVLSADQALALARSGCQARFQFSQTESSSSLRHSKERVDGRISGLEAEIARIGNTISRPTRDRMQRSLDSAKAERKRLELAEQRAADDERKADAQCEQEVRDMEAQLVRKDAGKPSDGK